MQVWILKKNKIKKFFFKARQSDYFFWNGYFLILLITIVSFCTFGIPIQLVIYNIIYHKLYFYSKIFSKSTSSFMYTSFDINYISLDSE